MGRSEELVLAQKIVDLEKRVDVHNERLLSVENKFLVASSASVLSVITLIVAMLYYFILPPLQSDINRIEHELRCHDNPSECK